MEEELRSETKEMEKNKIIRKSQSKFVSPCFVTRKSNGKIGLLMDYRALNAKALKEEYYFPGIDEVLQGLNGMKVFTTLDVNQGYYQIKLQDDSIRFTAFDLQF